jgi:hypothetical protein
LGAPSAGFGGATCVLGVGAGATLGVGRRISPLGVDGGLCPSMRAPGATGVCAFGGAAGSAGARVTAGAAGGALFGSTPEVGAAGVSALDPAAGWLGPRPAGAGAARPCACAAGVRMETPAAWGVGGVIRAPAITGGLPVAVTGAVETAARTAASFAGGGGAAWGG